jgi:hypothetical protein
VAGQLHRFIQTVVTRAWNLDGLGRLPSWVVRLRNRTTYGVAKELANGGLFAYRNTARAMQNSTDAANHVPSVVGGSATRRRNVSNV